MSIILIEAAGIQKEGSQKDGCKSFAQPIAIVAPINVLESLHPSVVAVYATYLVMFLGAFVIMELIKSAGASCTSASIQFLF